MPKIGKRLKSVRDQLGDVTDERSAEDALSLLKELTSVKFDESVDVAINLEKELLLKDYV